MKQFLFSVFILLIFFSTAFAQSEAQSFDVDGIKVIFKPTSKSVVNIRVYFRGGVSNYPADKEGIENLTLDAVTKGGTKNYSAKAFKDSADKYDILMYGQSTYDYGYIQINCISKYFNKGWELFSEAITDPAFDSNEVELLKRKIIIAGKERQSSPDIRLQEVLMRGAFKNTPYTAKPEGSEETLSKLTTDDLKKYYQTLLNKNRLFIVVVGRLTKEELVEKIISSFGNISSQPYSAEDYKDPVWNDNKITTEQSELPINYISAVLNAPGMTNIDYVPFQIGISGLAGNIYQTLRRDLNLSYSQGADLVNLRMPYVKIYATTKRPLEAMQAMVATLKRIQSDGVDDEWLTHLKNIYLTRSYIEDQSASEICSSLGHAEVMGGWQYAEDLPQLVKMATVEQVNRALNFYIVGLRWNYLGNTQAVEGAKLPVY
jgi:zinc protease